MKADLSPRNVPAPDPAQTVAPTHEHAHAHEHAHGPVHRHAAGHDHGTHTHAAKPPLASSVSERRTSLLMNSAPLRLAGAVALSVLLWAAVAWALSGTP